MRIAYMAASNCVHGHKWISHFAKHHDVILLCEEDSGDPVLYARSPEVKVLPPRLAQFPAFHKDIGTAGGDDMVPKAHVMGPED